MNAEAIYRSTGDAIDHTPASALTAGDVVLVGNSLLGVVINDIPANELGALQVYGVFDVQMAAEDIDAGDAVYWDDTAKKVTKTTTSNVLFGIAIESQLNGATWIRVRKTEAAPVAG